jgi:hypothetical protein
VSAIANGPPAGTLLDLLPDLYAVRDAERGGPLEAVLALLDKELGHLRDDVDGLYDDWFIETCAEWLVPYIGELVGVRGLRSTPAGASGRALVANTIGYRRRKGTAAVLEDLARDVTGWPARAVEFFTLLGWTQQLNHVRPGAGGTIDVSHAAGLELVDSPCDASAHTADVRHIDNRRGRHNIPNVGVFLWRLGAFALHQVESRPIPGHPGCFQLDPLGLERPLFNVGTPERDMAHIAEEVNVPTPVRRRALHDDVTPDPVGGVAPRRYMGEVDPVLRVWVDGIEEGHEKKKVGVCDLEPPDRNAGEAGEPEVTVDPARGRLRVKGGTVATKVWASWAYGFAGELGGGPYDRTDSLDAIFRAADADERIGPPTWQHGVWGEAQALDADVHTDLINSAGTGALDAWQAVPASERDDVAVICIMDSRTFAGDLSIQIPPGKTLVIVAADWPDLDPDPMVADRVVGSIDPSGPRPHIQGDIEVRCIGAGDERGTLVLDGLLVEGTVRVLPGSLGRLRLAHCTVLPDPGGAADPAPTAVDVEAGGTATQRNTKLAVELVRCSLGPVAATPFTRSLELGDSIVRGGVAAGAPIPAITAGDVRIQSSTVLGATAVRTIEASDSIFLDPVAAARRQMGCVRYSYVPEGSQVPRRFRCQPDGEEAARPSFVSLEPVHPGYAQLHPATPAAISSGASNKNEMGGFNFTRASDRLAHLRTRLDEYVRFGLESGVFLAT